MNILVIDIGGTNVKILASGHTEPRKYPSGPELTPEKMVTIVKETAKGWNYDVVSIGYPGVIKNGKIITEPHNLGPKWVGFDFESAFGCPVRLINDAAMQALGSYSDGILLFLGLGTGLGSALVVEGHVVPLELAHLSYKRLTYEDYLGLRGINRFGRKKWQKQVFSAVARLTSAFNPNDVVIGGGNAKKLTELPPGCRAGINTNAFIGGFRLWEGDTNPNIPGKMEKTQN
jgi:polyphosphate glucokinase